MSIIKSIQRNHFDMKENRGWDKTFWFFDLHSTVILPNYTVGDTSIKFYPYALEALQLISKLDDVVMVVYTCSHPHEIEGYIKQFEDLNVKFEYINKNPEIKSNPNGYGYYEDKPYFNVLFDDKAGFDGETDWEGVLKFLEYKYGIKEYRGLDSDNIEDLENGIESEGLGYWLQNYSGSWIKSDIDYELVSVLKDARDSINRLGSHLAELGIETD